MMKMPIEEKNAFEAIKKGQELFIQEHFFDGYLMIRENVNQSEISNVDIWSLLMGEISLYWEENDVFDIIEKENAYQKGQVEQIRGKYKQLIQLEQNYFEIVKEIDYSFFEMISPKNFQKNIPHPVGLLKNFMMDIQGDFFIIKDDKLFFVKEKSIEASNPFIKK